MKNKRITLKELAEILEVSPSTVSRALKNHHSIGKETSKKIQKTAIKLGYVPNSVASNLRRKKTNLIGIIVPRIDRHFHSLAISGIEKIANSHGYYVGIFQSNNSHKKEIENVKMLLSNNADGVIACLSLQASDEEHFKLLKDNNIPLVFYDRVSNKIESGKVMINDFEASKKACNHLIDRGCKKIAHIAGNQNSGIFKDRLEGYLSCLKANMIEIEHSHIYFGNNLDIEEGRKFANKVLRSKNKPDGVFCANDNTAIGFIQVANELGVSIPDEIAVVGFSNTPASTIIKPSLTTIDDHAFEMGQAAAQLLIRQIEQNSDSIASETVIIRNELIVRESS